MKLNIGTLKGDKKKEGIVGERGYGEVINLSKG